MSDVSVTPVEDFDEYVNGAWRRQTVIPADRSFYSVSDEVDDALFKDIIEICRTAAATVRENKFRKNYSRSATLLGSFYASGTASRAQQYGIETINHMLQRVDAINTINDVVLTTVEHIRAGLITTFQIVVSPDERETNISRLHLTEGDVPIQNLNLYEEPHSEIITQYHTYLNKIGDLFNIPRLGKVYQIEAILAKALDSDDDRGHPDRRYHRTTRAKLADTYTHIPWNTLWAALGLRLGTTDPATSAGEIILLPAPNYYKAVNRLFHTLKLSEWRRLLKSQIIHSLIRFLPPPFDELHFGFFGHTLHGDVKKTTQERLVVSCIREGIPDALTREYIKHVGPARAIAIRSAVTDIFYLLKNAMAEHIQKTKWMSNSTKRAALDKIRAMHGKIGFADEEYLRDYEGLELHPLYFVNNILACNRWCWAQSWARLEQPVDINEWLNGAIEVNAYYYPENNAVVVPFGILHPPFYDLRKSLAWNLGGIGCAIGHEICHGFDNEGKEYDASGNLAKWWTDNDARHFTTRANKLRDALDAEEHAGGHVDGELTLAEALADLTGIRIALDALLTHLVANDYDAIKRRDSIREFFVSYAVSWRKKERERYAFDILSTDPHPPASVRINLIVSLIPEWKEVWGSVRPTGILTSSLTSLHTITTK